MTTYYMTPKTLPKTKNHLKYGMFEIDDKGVLNRIGWDDDLNDLSCYQSVFSTSISMWGKSYPIDNFIDNISKDCIVFTKESHPEYFI